MRIEIFQGEDGGWYWHFVQSNGRITANGESFPSIGNARRAAKSVVRAVLKPVHGKNDWFERVEKNGITTIRWY